MTSFSSHHRPALIQQLSQQTFDVLVIGGGITGAGIALDAAARGLTVALVEMQDFASGTSGRSTKLVHGGLRYLKQLEFKMVADVGKEREIIHRLAPHLTRPEPMLMPITKNGSFGRLSTRLGMWVYEWLAGVKKNEKHRMLSAKETVKQEPCLQRNDLLGSALFYEYRTDDARLTLSVLKEAVKRGAVILNYMKVNGFTYEGKKITGAKVTDQFSKAGYTIKASYVINAAGPWVDELDTLDNGQHGNKLQLTKGVHLVVDHQKLPVRQSVYFDTYDQRMIFVIPREGKTYIGTTDTFYNEDKISPHATANDRDYLLKCVNDYFPAHALLPSDVESGWAGVRPLIRKRGKKPSEISRKDETFVWESGLITIAGGKLTGYRKMAKQITDLLAKKIWATQKKRIPACSTQLIPLSGGNITAAEFPAFVRNKIVEGLTLGLNNIEAERLVYRYGTEVEAIYAIMMQLKSSEENEQNLPLLLRAQLHYAIAQEMCMSPADFFIRRTSMLYFDITAVRTYGDALLKYMQQLMLWDEPMTTSFGKALEIAVLELKQVV